MSKTSSKVVKDTEVKSPRSMAEVFGVDCNCDTVHHNALDFICTSLKY